MAVVYKYWLGWSGKHSVLLPKSAHVLRVENQMGRLCLWAKVRPDQPNELRKFVVLLTGEPSEEIDKAVYIGTVLFENGAFVVHVFELLE